MTTDAYLFMHVIQFVYVVELSTVQALIVTSLVHVQNITLSNT